MQLQTTVLVADDHPLFRAALCQAVNEVLPDTQILEAADDIAVRGALSGAASIDVVLLDLLMPGSRSFATLAWIRSQYPGTAVIVVSASSNPMVVRRAMAFGAAGYVPKSAPLTDLRAAIAAVIDCGQWFPAEVVNAPAVEDERMAMAAKLASLTPQQFRVLELLSQGRLNKQIAAELGIGEQTTKAHVSAAMAKLGVRNRTQASLLFKELEIQDTDQLSLER